MLEQASLLVCEGASRNEGTFRAHKSRWRPFSREKALPLCSSATLNPVKCRIFVVIVFCGSNGVGVDAQAVIDMLS